MYWALINLILTLFTILLLLQFSRDKYKPFHPIGLIIPIISVLVFVFTEHTCYPMRYVDKWTILMLILFIVQFILRVAFIQKREEE